MSNTLPAFRDDCRGRQRERLLIPLRPTRLQLLVPKPGEFDRVRSLIWHSSHHLKRRRLFRAADELGVIVCVSFPPPDYTIAVHGIELTEIGATVRLVGRDQSRAATAEKVQHELASARDILPDANGIFSTA